MFNAQDGSSYHHCILLSYLDFDHQRDLDCYTVRMLDY